MPVRVVLVEDHVMVREAIRNTLIQSGPIEVAGETGDAETAYRLVSTLKPDVVILDIRLPKASGVDVTRELVERCPGVRILILSSYHWDEYGEACFIAGALGFISKDRPLTELVLAVQATARGEGYIPADLSPNDVRQLLKRRHSPRREGPLSTLSAREQEVFHLLLDGLHNKEIASKLFLSTRTVETHRAHIMRKLGVDSIAKLVRLGFECGAIAGAVPAGTAA